MTIAIARIKAPWWRRLLSWLRVRRIRRYEVVESDWLPERVWEGYMALTVPLTVPPESTLAYRIPSDRDYWPRRPSSTSTRRG